MIKIKCVKELHPFKVGEEYWVSKDLFMSLKKKHQITNQDLSIDEYVTDDELQDNFEDA